MNRRMNPQSTTWLSPLGHGSAVFFWNKKAGYDGKGKGGGLDRPRTNLRYSLTLVSFDFSFTLDL